MTEGITRSKDGVPQWSGEAASFQEYEEQALQWEQAVPYGKRYLCGPKLVQEMTGTARKFVTGKKPDWLSFDGGVNYLMQHLRKSLGRPQIPELSEYLNRYFKQSKRRRFETMNQYIVRKVETYQRAKQALARVLPHHQESDQSSWGGSTSWRRNHPWYERDDWSNDPRWRWRREEEADGREDQEDMEQDEFQDAAEDWDYNSSYNGSSRRSWWDRHDDERWTHETPDLLPDFLQGWYLLMDANLTSAEKNLIQTAVQGNFGSEKIAHELRVQWPEEDLKAHDQAMRQTGYWQEEVEEETGCEEGTTLRSLEEEGMNAEGLSLMADMEEQVEEAMAVIEKGKRTLKEARARQHQLKLSRQYYKTETEKYKTKTSGAPLKCFRCGGPHKIANCPDKSAPRGSDTKTEHAPFLCYAEDETAMVTEAINMTTEEAITKGYGVIDGGATKTLGSVFALEAVAAENYRKHNEDRIVEVDPRETPTFGFGNSSRNKCVSTTKVKIEAGEKEGILQVHTLEEGQGPVLLSISTLRRLGAIIDFKEDLIVFRELDDTKMIQATRSQSGHQLVPLTENLYRGAVQCHSAVPSLRSFC